MKSVMLLFLCASLTVGAFHVGKRTQSDGRVSQLTPGTEKDKPARPVNTAVRDTAEPCVTTQPQSSAVTSNVETAESKRDLANAIRLLEKSRRQLIKTRRELRDARYLLKERGIAITQPVTR